MANADTPRSAVPCARCRGSGRVELVSWLVRDLAPAWLASLSVSCFILQGTPREMDVLSFVLLLTAVGAAGLCMIAVIETGAWSAIVRLADFYRWIFAGRVPPCPGCGGAGMVAPRPERGFLEALHLILLMVLTVLGLGCLGGLLAMTH